MTPAEALPREFYARPALAVARDLLGMRVVRVNRGRRLSGLIVETEAYEGPHDLGSHARHGPTLRNQSMFGPPGHAYVYFSYGMHWMFNVVTEPEGTAAAVLIRGMRPEEGIATMRRRRGRPDAELTNGPGKLCQALDIDRRLDGVDLCDSSGPLYVERAVRIHDRLVTTGPRVGLYTVPEPWKSVEWRFCVREGG